MNNKAVLKKGLKNSVEVILALGKVIVPVTFLVTFLDHSGWLKTIASYAKPLMEIFGLPGESAIVLVIGGLTNVYGAVGAILNMELTQAQITILAVMITISHSLPSETAVVAKAGAKAQWVLFARIFAALLFGFLVSLLL